MKYRNQIAHPAHPTAGAPSGVGRFSRTQKRNDEEQTGRKENDAADESERIPIAITRSDEKACTYQKKDPACQLESGVFFHFEPFGQMV